MGKKCFSQKYFGMAGLGLIKAKFKLYFTCNQNYFKKE